MLRVNLSVYRVERGNTYGYHSVPKDKLWGKEKSTHSGLKATYETSRFIKPCNCNNRGHTQNVPSLLLIKVMWDNSTECVISDCVTYDLDASLVQDGFSVTMEFDLRLLQRQNRTNTWDVNFIMCKC